ncbi:hypothetical protein [Caballeronia sp. ATUFL_F1_KS4A]|uniref:hypothetical protein n=1 Tax=Caballeronia sp. ATUFL_F1_KS4A TaxID=2921768 RepID=UPI0020280C2F|nr:hypothetical protein [Caballeronia sp. ATUFL_F1_KS4A]
MVKRSRTIRLNEGATAMGTATVREARRDMTAAQRAIFESTGKPPSASAGFDDLADGLDAPALITPAYRRQAVAPSADAKQKLYALGRLPDGKENATEKRYAEHLEQRRRAGEIEWYCFEGIKLKLAPKTYLTVDYVVLPASGLLEMHDVKGARAIFSDDAKVKMKVAASLFPLVFKVAYPRKTRDGGGWDIEEIRSVGPRVRGV